MSDRPVPTVPVLTDGKAGDEQPLTGVAARTDRALRNFLEAFPFFAAAVLAVVVLDRGDATTALGAQCSMVIRVAGAPPMYLPRPCGRQSWRQVR